MIWLVTAVALAMTAGSATSAGAATPKCFGKKATIVGKQSADKGRRALKGTRRADVIVSLGGNDVVSGGAGNDRICGGAGTDKIDGGAGDDRIDGGAGKDTCTGGAGKNTFKGCETTDRKAANRAPLTGADAATTTEDAPVTIAVLANDGDPEKGFLAVRALSLTGARGTATLSGNSVVYDPRRRFDALAAGATATDSFGYTVADGAGGTAADAVTVTITGIDDGPTAVADAAQVQTPHPAPLAIDVLANDTDVDGGPKLIVAVTDFGSSGTVAITGGGTGLTYTPNSGLCSATPVTFSYTLNGGSVGIVSVTLACPAPGTALDDAATIAEDGSVVVDVLANDVAPAQGANVVQAIGSPAHGIAITDAGGIKYTPTPNFCGPDAFTYTLDSGKSATVSATVTCVNDAPAAADDTFDTPTLFAVGNTTLAVGTTVGEPSRALAGNLLANDQDVEGDTVTVVPGVVTGTLDGKVTLNTDGSFVYRPPPGLTGIVEYFVYTASDGNGGTDTAEVGILLKDPIIWYVDSAAAPGGNGTSGAPLQTLEDLGGGADLDQPGDLIYVRQRDGTVYQGGAFLEADQQLIGSKRGLTVDGIVLAAPTATQPVITNQNGIGVTLANGAQVYGVKVDQTSQAGMAGVSIANATIGSDVTISNPGLDGFVLSGAASGTVTFAGDITGSMGTEHVDVRDRTGGSVTFSGPISGLGGIYLGANATTPVTFSGQLNVSSNGRPAFSSESGGTLAVTANGNVLSATGRALSVTTTPIAADGLRFQSISAQGTDSGIVLNDTGQLGGLTVTGSGFAESGGTITNALAPAISLTKTARVFLNLMRINGPAHAGIKGTDVNTFSFTNGKIFDAGGAATSADDAAIAFNTANARNLSGVVTITGNAIYNPYGSAIDIQNNAGTISEVTISGNTLESTTSTATSKGSGIRVWATTAAGVTRGSVANNSIQNFPNGNGVDLDAYGGASVRLGTKNDATDVVTVSGNQIVGDATSKMAYGIVADASGGSGNVRIINNGTVASPVRNLSGAAIYAFAFAGQTSYTIDGNVVAPGGASSAGILLSTNSNTMDALVANNTISATGLWGVDVRHVSGIAQLRVKVAQNTVARPTGPVGGIRVMNGESDAFGSDPITCLNIASNTTTGGVSGPDTLPGIELLNRAQPAGGPDYRFVVHGIQPNTFASGLETYVAGLNPGSALGAGVYAGKRAVVRDGSVFQPCINP